MVDLLVDRIEVILSFINVGFDYSGFGLFRFGRYEGELLVWSVGDLYLFVLVVELFILKFWSL